jgi:hypothetical protein
MPDTPKDLLLVPVLQNITNGMATVFPPKHDGKITTAPGPSVTLSSSPHVTVVRREPLRGFPEVGVEHAS